MVFDPNLKDMGSNVGCAVTITGIPKKGCMETGNWTKSSSEIVRRNLKKVIHMRNSCES
jgi:hypothetical protein